MLFDGTRKWLKQVIDDLGAWLGTTLARVRDLGLELWKVWGPVIQNIFKCMKDANDLVEAEPRIAKDHKRKRAPRPSKDLERRVVRCLKQSNGPITVSQLLRGLLRSTQACDLRAIRRQVLEILRRAPDVVRVSARPRSVPRFHWSSLGAILKMSPTPTTSHSSGSNLMYLSFEMAS